jgi:uncharacterized protein YigE (DUF2233 family)
MELIADAKLEPKVVPVADRKQRNGASVTTAS